MTNKVQAEEKRAQLRKAALEYHEFPSPGKIAIAATKQLVNQHDLALAYSPGVAAPCEEIVKDGQQAGHGRQGRAVQEVLGHRRVRH
jgi:malate dehydrogenase (oxaloacetate-decarboxylating)(NADP+)